MMRELPAAAIAFAVRAALAACSSDTSLPIEPACNPLGAGHCMTPWPSSAFEVGDPASATGRRLAIPEGALPSNADGVAADPAGWNVADGFSPVAPLVMSWKGGVSADGLPPRDHVERSLAADSPTAIIDMTTGARIAHAAAAEAQAVVLRPAARLIGGHRYAVAITRRVRAADGSELAVPPGFAALREPKNTDHALLEAMRPRFGDVLAAFAAAGFSADELVVAWDFTVASDAALQRDMRAARDRAIAELDAHPSALAITGDAPIGDGKLIRRRITGTLDAPLFLTQGGAADRGTTIARDGAGLPALQGRYPIPFTAIVPACAYTASQPVAMVVYGHDPFSGATETAGARPQATAAERCAVLVGTELRGVSERDLPAVARMLNDISRADEVIDVVEQGLVNQLALVRAMRTVLARVLVDAGRPLVDPARLFYGGAGREPSVLADELAVTGAPSGPAGYAALLERSADWPRLRATLAVAYPDPVDAALVLGLFQMRWDRVEN